jgi:hypothetical protein
VTSSELSKYRRFYRKVASCIGQARLPPRDYRPFRRRLQSGASIPVAANIQTEGSGVAEDVNCLLAIADDVAATKDPDVGIT